MIKPNKEGTKLWFLPPEKSTEQEMEFPLVYAQTCPKCNNLVQAVFMTDKKIDPKPWEEIYTKMLDANGKFKRIIPGRQERFRSRYEVKTMGRGTSVSAQLVRFTEHFDLKEDPTGVAPICGYVAISTSIPEYRVYDMLLACLMDPSQYSLKDSDYPEVKHRIQHGYTGPDHYAFADAVGNGPEAVFVSRQAYKWFIMEVVAKYIKPYTNPLANENPW